MMMMMASCDNAVVCLRDVEHSRN